MEEVERFEMFPHPIEFDMYYSVLRRDPFREKSWGGQLAWVAAPPLSPVCEPSSASPVVAAGRSPPGSPKAPDRLHQYIRR